MKVHSNNFLIDNAPFFQCPSCKIGVLKIMDDTIMKFRPGSYEVLEDYPNLNEESGITRKATKFDIKDSLQDEFICSFYLECINEKCKEKVVTSGRIKTEELIEYEEESSIPSGGALVEVYYPKHFEPAIPLFEIPENTPESVVKEIENSFKVFWASSSSCGNSLRIVVEKLLDELNILKDDNNYISLGRRLQEYDKVNSELSRYLNGIRFIGNHGSHNSDLTTEDVIHAYMMIEFCLIKIYNKSESNLEEKLNEILRFQKPMSKIRRSE